MALVVATIQSTIKASLDATYGVPPTPAGVTEQAKFTLALANALFTVLTTQATVAVASVSAVTPGVGVSGPGAGTIT